MLQLTPWKVPPKDYRLLVLFDKSATHLDLFQEMWQINNGDINMKIAKIKHSVSSASKAIVGTSNYVLFIDQLPALHFLNYWQESGCKLYYQPLSTNSNPFKKKEEQEKIAGDFVAWGHDFVAKKNDRNVLKLVDIDADNNLLTFAPKLNFHNFFEYFSTAESTNAEVKEDIKIKTALKPIKQDDNFTIQIKLSKAIKANVLHNNLDESIYQLREEIEFLQHQLERYEWEREEKGTPSHLFLYTETEDGLGGTLNHLKEWFIQMPDKAIKEFLYARIEVAGTQVKKHQLTQESVPLVLHVLKPVKIEKEPLFQPPRPKYKLLLDNHWHAKDFKIYTPEDMQLYPNPPRKSNRLLTMLSDSLWDIKVKNSPEKEKIKNTNTLLFLDHEGEMFRFTIEDHLFEPLKDHIAELNIKCIHDFKTTGQYNLEPLLKTIDTSFQQSVTQYKEQGVSILENIEETYIRNQEYHQEQMDAALKEIQIIKKIREGIRELKRKQYATWKTFRDKILRLDRSDAVPNISSNAKGILENIDELRNVLTSHGNFRKKELKEDVANELREIADKLHKNESK